jgi:hypothetical protein
VFLTVIFVFVAIGAGVGGYLLGNRDKRAISPSQPSPHAVTITQIPTTLAHPTNNQPTTIPTISFPLSSDVHADWKTFSNTAYSYTLQYPPDYNLQIESWDAYGDDPTMSRTVSFNYAFNKPERYYLVGVEADRGSNVDTTRFYQWVHDDVNKTIQKDNAIQPNLSKLGFFKEISVDNRPAIFVEYLSGLSEGTAGYAIYILNNNNTIYSIFTSEFSASQTEEKANFVKMVSTFHFTAQ